MRSKLFLIAFLLFCSNLLGQSTFNLPQVANGSGIQTTFIFFNNGEDESTVLMNLRDDNGAPLAINIPGLGSTNPYLFMLPAGETRFFTSDGAGGIQVGAAQVTSTSDIGVSAIFSLVNAPAGTSSKGTPAIITEAGIGAAEGTGEFAIAVDTTGDFNTGVAVQNLSGSSSTLTFNLFDSQGIQQGSSAMRTLAGNGHFSGFVDGPGGLFPSLGDFQGKMVVSATTQVAALTLRQNVATGNPLTTLPAVATDSTRTSFTLPQVAKGAGIKTTFVMFNLSSSQTANVVMTLTGDNGGALSASLSDGQNGSLFSFAIPPCGAVFVETQDAGAVQAGAARVTSDVPIGVSAIFTLLDGLGNISTEAGVGDSPALADFSLPVDLTSGFNTGMALFNGNGAPANVQVTFIQDDGSIPPQAALQLRVAPFDLAPSNHLAQFVSELIQGLGAVQGQLSVSSSLPISALTLRQGPTTLTTLPVVEGVADTGGGGTPPTGSNLLPEFRMGVTATGNVTVNEQLEAGFLVTGDIDLPGIDFGLTRGLADRVSILSSVEAIRTDGERFTGFVSIFTGAYGVIVPSGSYTIRICYLSTETPALPSLIVTPRGMAPDAMGATFVTHNEQIGAVNQNRTVDITAPTLNLASVTGTVNLGNLPPEFQVGEVGLVFSADPFAGTAFIGSGGTFDLELLPGETYNTNILILENENPLDPGSPNKQGGTLTIGEVTVNGPTNGVSLTVPPLVRLTGVVSQPQTPVIPDDAIVFGANSAFLDFVRESCFPVFGAVFGQPMGDGSYRMTLVGNRQYGVQASLPITSLEMAEEGLWTMPFGQSSLQTFGVNTILDFNFPATPPTVTVSGRVTGPDGQGVAGVDVDFFTDSVTGAPSSAFLAGTTTDAGGNYSVTIFSGTNYTVGFSPPDPDLLAIPAAQLRVERE